MQGEAGCCRARVTGDAVFVLAVLSTLSLVLQVFVGRPLCGWKDPLASYHAGDKV